MSRGKRVKPRESRTLFGFPASLSRHGFLEQGKQKFANNTSTGNNRECLSHAFGSSIMNTGLDYSC